MRDMLRQIYRPVLPFLILGISIAVFVAFIMVLSYVLFWGFLIGLSIWVIVLIKNFFFAKKKAPGRIIEHQD